MADQVTYMTNNDFILARNSGTPPVKLLFDKSLSFAKQSIQVKQSTCLALINKLAMCSYLQFLKLRKILDRRNYNSS